MEDLILKIHGYNHLECPFGSSSKLNSFFMRFYNYTCVHKDLLSSASWDSGHSTRQTQCSEPLESGILPHSTATEVDPISQVAKGTNPVQYVTILTPHNHARVLRSISAAVVSPVKNL